MGKADLIYDSVVQDIIMNGVWDKDQIVRTKWADGTPAYTKSIISTTMRFDNTEVPLLTKKKTAWKTAIKEGPLLFWQKKTNKLSDMHDMNVHIWDEWELPDGTIGPSYGYQLGKQVRNYDIDKVKFEHLDPRYGYEFVHSSVDMLKLDQVDYLIQELKNNPASRRHVTSLWNIDELDGMALNPCVWHTQWLVKENRLHLIVGVRSNDMALGNPFNVFQYYVLQRMIAQVTGYELGTLTFNINDAHVYERHIEPLAKQILLPDYPAPTLEIDPDIKNFYDFTIDSFKLHDYKHGPTIPMEVAI